MQEGDAAPRYSPKFARLIAPSGSIQRFTEGSGASPCDLKEWEQRREFLAAAVNASGTFFDVGCGNGFLLRCLQEWSLESILPFGIDIDADRIQQARELFPQHSKNFEALGLHDLGARYPARYPGRFDFVYCSLWHHQSHDSSRLAALIETLLAHTSRRLVLGVYGTNRHGVRAPEHRVEWKGLHAHLEALERLGFDLHGPIEGAGKRNNLAVWIKP